MKDSTYKSLSPEFREAFAILSTSKAFNHLIKFLSIQQNNLAVIEWFRVKSTDPQIGIKKAYYEGQFEILKVLLDILKQAKKGKE